MQTTHRNEKGLSATNAHTRMQTNVDIYPRAQVLQAPAAPILKPRHSRILEVLLMGECSSEEIDEIAGADNGPDEIMTLRRAYELDIPCRREQAHDRDQHRVEFGIYELTGADRVKASRLVCLSMRGAK